MSCGETLYSQHMYSNECSPVSDRANSSKESIPYPQDDEVGSDGEDESSNESCPTLLLLLEEAGKEWLMCDKINLLENDFDLLCRRVKLGGLCDNPMI